MDGFLDGMQFWHWLILAAVFAGLEIMTPGFFFIWLGAAGLATGLIVLVAPALGWENQLVVFAALSAISVLAWYKFGRKFRVATDDATLNRRSESLIGRVGNLIEPIVNGRGKVKIDDSVWNAEGTDQPMGTQVKITGVRGTILLVDRAG
jgi:membrane protein implicated in regulation of membrane protease activity